VQRNWFLTNVALSLLHLLGISWDELENEKTTSITKELPSRTVHLLDL